MTATLYYCDPERNKACSKSGCRYNGKSKYPVCNKTTNPQYAKLDADGNPLIAVYVPEKEESP